MATKGLRPRVAMPQAKSAACSSAMPTSWQRAGWRLAKLIRPVPVGMAAVMATILLLSSAKSAGFTLDEIGELLRLDAGGDRQRVRDLARNRIAALDARIAELS